MQTLIETKTFSRLRGLADGTVAIWRAITAAVRDRIVGPLQKWHRYRRTVSELRALNDRMLRDIGIERWQIDAYARGAFDAAPSPVSDTRPAPRTSANDNKAAGRGIVDIRGRIDSRKAA